ncbi:MAG: hypothetical protein PHQ64_01025 [Bacilli bacterium]|nr:hypothetical protein [Bacilli bacterium]
MLRAFLTSFKLENTYKVNSFIYSLKQLPLIRRIIPNRFYGNLDFKIIGIIISFIRQIISTFLWKILYVYIMIFIPAMEFGNSNSFIHIFIFLTIIGSFINTNMFNPTKDKYYALVLMKMDPTKYAVSNYIFYLLKVLIGFIPIVVILGLMTGVKIYLLILLPVVITFIKAIGCSIQLFISKKKKTTFNENFPAPIVWIMVVLLLVLAYVLPYIGIVINEYIYIALFIISIIGGIVSIRYIIKYDNYFRIYKELLKPNAIIFDLKNVNVKTNYEMYSKKIDKTVTADDNKIGYDYFNDIFVKRHRSILTKSSKRVFLILLGILILIIGSVLLIKGFDKEVNKLPLLFLPYFLFIMYILNRGTVVSQAMFMNCDHSMLAYRFYRQSETVLELFKRRLKVLIKINLFPSLVIAIGLPLLLLITGGTNNILNYFLLFISIISMSIFFSVHHMVLYYLLQPYNVDMEMKNSTYTVANSVTYFLCYMMMQMRIPTIIFGSIITLFAIVYVVISLILVYKLAPKTFKLK